MAVQGDQQEALTTYEQASGLKVNMSKSDLLPLGNSDISNWETTFNILPQDAEIRYLGAKLGHSVDGYGNMGCSTSQNEQPPTNDPAVGLILILSQSSTYTRSLACVLPVPS